MTEAADRQPDTDDIAGKTKRGLLWRFAAKGVAGVIDLGVGIVLARLLMPEDFGIMALAYMVIGFIGLFQSIGLPAALVQREEITEDHRSTAFWTTLLMGFLLAGVMILLAGPAAVFFKEENVRGVMYLLSISMLLGPIGSVPGALLQRRIDFKRLFWPDIVGGVVYGGVGITMAYLGYSYWSLAWASIARGLTGTVVVVSLAGYVPRLTWRYGALRDLLGFGVPVTLSGGLAWAAHNVDYFIIGRVLPTSALGIYKKAYEWVAYPWKKVVAPTYGVLFPAFSRLQNEPERLRYAYGRAITGLSLVSFPPLVLLAALAPQLIPAVFGEQWAEAIIPTQILCGVGVLRCLGNTSGALINACGYVKAAAWCNVLHFIVLTAAIGATVRSGIVAVCWGVLSAQAVNAGVVFYIVWLAAEWTPLSYCHALRAPIIASAIMGGSAIGVRYLLELSALSPTLVWVLTATVAVALYVSILISGAFQEEKRSLIQYAQQVLRGVARGT